MAVLHNVMHRLHIHDGYDEIPQSPLERLKPLREKRELRISTFRSWPKDVNESPKPTDLCDNGFYYMGIGDKVQCAYCGGVLSGWRSDDDIRSEHARHFGKCPFVNNLPNNDDIEADGVESDTSDDIETDGDGFHVVLDRGEKHQGFLFGNTNERKDGIIKPTNVKIYNTTYTTFQERLNSFKDWPASHSLKPEELAEAGLYYKGEGDKCQCYACGGILAEWEDGDIPKEEHKKWFGKCRLND